MPFDTALVHRVAGRFAADLRGGMEGLARDVRGCYAAADRGTAGPVGVRDCMALDTAAKNQERADGRRHSGYVADYFSDNAGLARFNRYAPAAFGSREEALHFVGTDGRAAYFQGTALLNGA